MNERLEALYFPIDARLQMFLLIKKKYFYLIFFLKDCAIRCIVAESGVYVKLGK